MMTKSTTSNNKTKTEKEILSIVKKTKALLQSAKAGYPPQTPPPDAEAHDEEEEDFAPSSFH